MKKMYENVMFMHFAMIQRIRNSMMAVSINKKHPLVLGFLVHNIASIDSHPREI